MPSEHSRIAILGRRVGSLSGHALVAGARTVARLPSLVSAAGVAAVEVAAVVRGRWTEMRRIWNETRMTNGDTSDRLGIGDETAGQIGVLVREGSGVRLRTQVPANRPAFQRWYADPEIARLLRHDQEPLTDVQSRGYFDTIILPLSARGLCFAIHESDTDAVVGMTALTDLQPGPGTALFRIVIGEKDRWGRGYGTEATRLVAREAFERLGLRELRLEVFRHNPRALAVYERVGFETSGEHVEWVARQGMRLDVVEMRLRRDDFRRVEAERSAATPVDIHVGDDSAVNGDGPAINLS